jgi:hypothetical protein
MDEATRTIRYWPTAEASATLARMLADYLVKEGVHVEWTPPSDDEERNLAEDIGSGVASGVGSGVLLMVIKGEVRRITEALRKFRTVAPQAKFDVEPDDGGFLPDE